MKKIISVILCAVLLSLNCIIQASAAETDLHFAVVSDIHYNLTEDELVKTNDDPIFWYANRRAAMDNESGFILDEFLRQASEAEYDFILISGDMADNGRKTLQEHIDVSKKLSAFEEETGIPVYLIPGNHDYSSYDGETNLDDMIELYGNFGYNDALEKRDTDFSYVTDLSDKYRLIAVDSCDPSKSTEDGMTADKVEWVIRQAQKAADDGKYPILMMHHNLLDHLPLQRILSHNFIIRNHITTANRFANAGIKLVFTGHEHCSDVAVHTSPAGNKIYDFATTSLSMYPTSYRDIHLNDNEITYESRFVEKIDTDALRAAVDGYTDDMINAMDSDFNAYAKGYLKAGVQYRLTLSLSMEKLGISEDSIFHDLVYTAVSGLTDILEMPLYGENSVSELAKEYGIEIPETDYENAWSLATELVAYHYSGEEPFNLNSDEIVAFLRIVNLILLDDLSTVNDEIFLGAANLLFANFGTDSICNDLTKLGANTFGSVTAGQYFLLALVSPLLYEFISDSDNANDNNGSIDGYEAANDNLKNAEDYIAYIFEKLTTYITLFFSFISEIGFFGIKA